MLNFELNPSISFVIKRPDKELLSENLIDTPSDEYIFAEIKSFVEISTLKSGLYDKYVRLLLLQPNIVVITKNIYRFFNCYLLYLI